MTRFIFRNLLLIFTFLFLFGLSLNAPVWASGEHQTIPTVTPGGGTYVPLPDGLSANPTPTSNTGGSPLQVVMFVAGGAVLLLGVGGGGLYVLTQLGWIKFPK